MAAEASLRTVILSISLKSILLKDPSVDWTPSITNRAAPIFLILIEVPIPGSPLYCLKFTPAIFPARAEDEDTDALFESLVELIAEMELVSDSFLIPLPYPVTTTWSILKISS
jgi:hypothetical protein